MVVLIVVEVVLYYHFSIFPTKNGRFSLKKEANPPTFLSRLQPIMATSCVPTMQESRSGAAGTAFRRLRNGREVYPDEQGSAPLRPIQPCKNYRNSGGSGNITPLPPLLLPPANTLIHNEIVQKVAEVVIKLQKN